MTIFSGAGLVHKNIACYEAASAVVFLTSHSFSCPRQKKRGCSSNFIVAKYSYMFFSSPSSEDVACSSTGAFQSLFSLRQLNGTNLHSGPSCVAINTLAVSSYTRGIE